MAAADHSRETNLSEDDDDAETTTEHAHFWEDDRGRRYVSGNPGDIVRLPKLIAYAEHGEEALEADEIHHGLTANVGDEVPVRIDAPEFLFPVDEDEHRAIHGRSDWEAVDGIPMLLPEREQDEETQ
jgi:hypothetical protein